MRQLSLSFQPDVQSLMAYFEKAAGKKISLVITDNSTSMLSFKEHRGSAALRLHSMFLDAGTDVLDEMAVFIKNKKGKTPLINDFIRQNRHRLKNRPLRKVNIRTEGKHYSLLDMYASVNKEYFEGRISASITWGAKGPKRAARKRTLGSYSSHNNMIRINPMLDNKNVPGYFLEYVVYHEMLHADMNSGRYEGKRPVHSKEFRDRERQFRHHEKCVAWENKRW